MKKLFIPEKIVLEKQTVPGMGKRELRQFCLSALPGLALAFVLFFALEAPGPRLIALLLGFFYAGACFSIFVKIDGTLSIYIYLVRVWTFQRAQKNYYYKHGKETIYHAQDVQP